MSSNVSRERRLVGMLHEPIPPAAQNVGISVATEGFARALNTSAARYRYELFCDPRRVQLAKRILPRLTRHVTVSTREGLIERLDRLAPLAWHDSGLDTYRPFALRARSKRPFPITVLHHSLSYKELLHNAWLRLLLSRPVACDSIICTSRAARVAVENILTHVAEAFRREYGVDLSYQGRFDEIPLGVDTDCFRPSDHDGARKRLELPGDAFILLWFGRLTPIDKADLTPLLQVLRVLADRNPGRRLLLLVAGNQRPGEAFGDRLLARADGLGLKEQVRLVLNPADPASLYQAADVFVSPVDSPQETFGIAPLEAMASGLPQVVSDWSGYRDTVVHGKTGFLIPTIWSSAVGAIDDQALLSDSALDHLALAQSVVVDGRSLDRALQTMIDNPSLRASMGEASRARALQLFAWPQIIARYESLWEELARQCAARTPIVRSSNSYASPRYFDQFQHFASAQLALETMLEVTATGREAVDRKTTPSLPLGDDWFYLDRGTLRRILSAMAKQPSSGGTCVDDLLASFECTEPGEGDRIKLHLLWLMKYGLVAPSQ